MRTAKLLLSVLAAATACNEGSSGDGNDFGGGDDGGSPTQSGETGPPGTTGGATTGDSGDGGADSGAASGSTSADSGTSEDTSTGGVSSSVSSGTASTTPTATASTNGTTLTTSASIIPCQEETVDVRPDPPRIMMVLDKSGSMTDVTWDHDNDGGTPEVTRWNTLHGVVDNMLAQWQASVQFGVKLYPNRFSPGGIFSCPISAGVDVGVAIDNRMPILSAIPGPLDDTNGRTPMESALRESMGWIANPVNVDPSVTRALILVADGLLSAETEPSGCPGEVFSEAEMVVASGWINDQIATYVVGIGIPNGGEADNQLTALANAGGVPLMGQPEVYFQVQDQADLDAAMAAIVDDTLSCVVEVDPVPSEPDLFEVWLGANQVPEVGNCLTEDGWVWANQYDSVELCGTACDDLKATGTADLKYYCEPG